MRRVIAVAALGLLVLAACGTDDNGDNGDNGALPGPDCVDRTGDVQALVELQDNRFAEECIEISTAAGFEIRNTGQALHNFSIQGVPMVNLDVQPGETNNTESPGLAPGTYTMFCSYHEAAGMEAELRIVEG